MARKSRDSLDANSGNAVTSKENRRAGDFGGDRKYGDASDADSDDNLTMGQIRAAEIDGKGKEGIYTFFAYRGSCTFAWSPFFYPCIAPDPEREFFIGPISKWVQCYSEPPSTGNSPAR